MQINNAIKTILEHRGISAADEVAEFLSDKPQKTYDPFLLLNMEEGVDLVLSSIDEGKKICIYGDYDTDGVTSTVLLRDVLTELGADVTSYIPSRFDDGYGLNTEALDKIKRAGVDLVITVDCGCTSVKEVEYAKSIGLEIMITDHHTLKEEKPDCILIDPMQEECQYPFKSLAGVGVAFKLCQALQETTGIPKEVLTRNLDLVGLGTIVDIVPLKDENRTIAKYGLRALNVTERPGLCALFERIGIRKGEIDSRTISYIVGPHINAAGRVDNASIAVKLLQTKDREKAKLLTEELVNCNMKRKELQEELQVFCDNEITHEAVKRKRFILVSPENAHEGIIGIVAGKLKEEFSVPVLITTPIGDGEHKGTGRSPSGINLVSLLMTHQELFTRLGGHAAACGFSIMEENIPLLKEALSHDVQKILSENPDAFKNEVVPEIIMDSEDVNLDFTREQKRLEPFGKDNEPPIIGINLYPKDIARMGDGRFLRFVGTMENGASIRGVDFRNADAHENVLRSAERMGNKVLAIGTLEAQTWNDKEYVQMNVKALR